MDVTRYTIQNTKSQIESAITRIQGVPKVRSHLAFANKTEYIVLGSAYYHPMCFPFMARHFATRCRMPATRSRGVAGLMLAHADFKSAVSC